MASPEATHTGPQRSASSLVDRIPGGESAPALAPFSGRVHVELIEDLRDLQSRTEEWNDLAESAAQPNVFYEPWMLLPALKAFGGDAQMRFALVYRESSRKDTPPLLCGLFPFEERKLSPRLPVRTLALWTHRYCFLTTPLLRRGHETVCVEAVLEELSRGRPAASLVEFPCVHGEGTVDAALSEVLAARQANSFEVSRHARALLDARCEWSEYVAGSVSNRHRSELRRQRRRLGELGDVTLRVVTDAAHCDFWVDKFLELEASGWKGLRATAMKQDPSHAEFFKEVIQGAARRNKLMMLGLFLNNEPIALKCNLLSGRGAFAVKIAYDESLKKFSPGVHLEIENIRIAAEHPEIDWMDSCAVPKHFMINRLWRERRTVRRLLVSTGRWAGDAVVGLWPAARTIARRVRRGKRSMADG